LISQEAMLAIVIKKYFSLFVPQSYHMTSEGDVEYSALWTTFMVLSKLEDSSFCVPHNKESHKGLEKYDVMISHCPSTSQCNEGFKVSVRICIPLKD